jgi:hypothetical protein
MKSLNRKVVILTVFILANVSFAGIYSGGSGTAEDPYQIGTVGDWNELMDSNSDWDANFVMTSDINLQGVPLIPVGNTLSGTYYRFTGIFDGNGHVIRNAEINMPGYWHIGLFGVINANSQIRNLGVEDVNMSGERDIAGLVGCNEGTITNCYATGKIGYPTMMPSGGTLGGLVGFNYGTIKDSHAACDINAMNLDAGGLVGRNWGDIIDSYSAGIVNGYENVGGLVGNNMAEDSNFIGTITRCYATGSVSGYRDVGGLTGNNSNLDFYWWCSITDSYSTCEVTGSSYVAGLVGHGVGQLSNCYAAGRVTGSGGGLTGSSAPPVLVSNCFWDIEATGKTISGGGTGLTTAEMKTLAPFISAGWDFVDTWGIGENQTYPFLRSHSGADLNYDAVVNMADFAIFAERWLDGTD